MNVKLWAILQVLSATVTLAVIPAVWCVIGCNL